MRRLRLASAVLVPGVVLLFTVSERAGLWDWWYGHDFVIEVAERFETSHAEDVDRQVGPDERAWIPTLRLIRRYSAAELPSERAPKILARGAALASGKQPIGPGRIVEWTAPATPILLVYTERSGRQVEAEDVLVVGSIGDLRGWVDRSRNDIRFNGHDGFLGLIALLLSIVLWVSEETKQTAAARS
jgi:hypothetical protein